MNKKSRHVSISLICLPSMFSLIPMYPKEYQYWTGKALIARTQVGMTHIGMIGWDYDSL